MKRLLFRHGSPRLGSAGRSLLLPCIIALTVYLGALGGAAMIAVGDGASGWDAALARSMTLQVPADTSAARLKTVVALLRQTRGLSGVRLLEPEETARLVQPWLGPSFAGGRLPVPQLVEMRVDEVAPPDLAALRERIASIAPDARLEADGQSLAPWRTEAYRLTGAIGAFVGLALLVSVSATVSDVRSRLALHRDELDLLHLLGAADKDILYCFAGAVLGIGLAGAGVGSLAAALTLFSLGGGHEASYQSLPAAAPGIADWRVWLILAGAAILGAAIPVAVGGGMVRRHLAQMP